MKNCILMSAALLALCMDRSYSQASPASSKPVVPQAAASETPPTAEGLSDLSAMTFDCPKAALNAAAREAANVPSQGTYQFSYFKVINDAHHAAYEVRFKSNYEGEPDLKYCVSMYCQQGWDPKTSKAEVTLMTDEPNRSGASRHGSHCGAHSAKKEH